jgi:hypothetical protein
VTRFVAPALLLAVAGFVVGCAQGSGAHGTADGGTEDGMVVDGKPSPIDAAAPDGCVASTELCNGKDDDCDGASDEDLGIGMPCDGADSDACKEGMVVCNGAGGTTCDDMTSDTVEICNGLDDDCQNGADDTFPVGQACSVGVGACATTGMRICDAAMSGTTCTAMSGAPTAETCGNSIDEDCSGADITCPGNDMPAGAINISAGGTWNVDVSAAHDDNYAPSTASMPCGNMGGRDAFFQFSLPAEEVVYYDTYGSNFDTVVRIFAGNCTSLGATLVCSDDSCNGTRSIGAVDLTAGTYCMVVDQYSSNTTGGMATLTFRRGGRPGVPLPAASGTVTGSTTGKSNLSVASCESNTNQPDVGHFFLTCPSFTYTIDASTCTNTSFDSVLYLKTGSATSADVACSDDVSGCGANNFQSRITGAAVVGGNVHWIIVDGFGSSGNGSYSLTYSIQ